MAKCEFAETALTETMGEIIICELCNDSCGHDGDDAACTRLGNDEKERLHRNRANDHGLKEGVSSAIQAWYRCEYQIKKHREEQESCCKIIRLELDSAKKFGYSKKEIMEQIGVIKIPSWHLVSNL